MADGSAIAPKGPLGFWGTVLATGVGFLGATMIRNGVVAGYNKAKAMANAKPA